ncbi:hypothetical protein [Myxococcus stipitatus]|uniref:hypothetical protein n=1 Tax=Myxococcus stipitatus TaxID=83455 RepID=UPI0030D03FDD
MKKLMFGLMAAGTLLFGAGCGGTACDALDEANRSLDTKAESCGSTRGEDEAVDFDKGVCEDALDHCSDSDKDRLNELADCLKDLPNCAPGGEMDWVSQVNNCSSKLADVSPACAAAATGR